LGISFIGSILYYFINPDWIFLWGLIPYLLMFISFGKEINLNKRSNRITIEFYVLCFIAIVAMFFYSLQDNQIEINDNIVKIKGDYGWTLKQMKLSQLNSVNELPEISIKNKWFCLTHHKERKF
jgi:uncharacterized protein with PQ loop repeat